MWGLFPCIPILGVFVFFSASGEGGEGWKKGIMGWGYKVLHGILSKIHQYNVTTEPIAMMANNKANH